MTMPAGRRPGTKSTALKDRLPWWGEGEAPEKLWPGVSLTYPAIWSSRSDRWESHEGAYYFDPDSAAMAVDFFPTFLKHHIGEFAGRAFQLREDQDKLLTRPIFGWKQAATGRRRFRKVFAFCPKGWGKSPWGAGTGIYLARYDNEPAAEVYAVAADIQQARIVHGNAKIMVESDPDLEAGSEVLRDSIVWAAVHASYRVLSSDASTKHGFRPHGVIFDEMHAQKNRDLYEALSKSMVKRRQPLMIIITHAGTDDEGICVAPNTKVLTSDLRWVKAGDVSVGDVLAGFDEHRRFIKSEQLGNPHRLWRSTDVTHKSEATLPCYRLTLTDGTEVTCSEDHQWLIQTAGRRTEWRKTKDLTLTDSFCKVLDTWEHDTSWRAGYLAGLLDSEGHISAVARSHLLCGFTQRPNGVLRFGQELLAERGFRFGVYDTTHNGGEGLVYQTMVTRKRDVLRMLGSVRPMRILERFKEIGWEHLRFKAHTRPTLARKEFIGPHVVVGLKTTSHTFVAEGLASHNCYEEYDLAQRVLSGSANVESTLPVLFQIRKGEDWTDETTWRRVNPGHGTTVQHDAIAVECQEALAEPRKRNDFLRYHLNKWTSQATAWIPIEWWDACQAPLLPDSELAKLPVAAGLDLAQKWDLASFVLVFKHVIDRAESVEVVTEENGTARKKQIALNYAITLLPFFWIPENTMRQHEKEDGVPYSLWVEQGLVTATEGDIIDYTVIYNDITQKILPRFPKLKQGIIGYDSWGATDIATKLRDLAGLPIEEVAQQYSGLNEPAQVYEALIKGRRVYQNGHRPMRWCHENLAVKTDDLGRIKPVKPKNPSKRVDGGVAAIMGLKMLSGLVPTQEVSLFFLPRR